MLAPCSDICRPIKFSRSNLGNLAPEGGPMDDGPKLASSPFAPPREALGVVPLDDALSSIDILPNLGADIENHDLSIPPSDGMTLEMEPASVIDPDLTPSPISRISKKYSLVASNFGEPVSSSSIGSFERAKKKTRSFESGVGLAVDSDLGCCRSCDSCLLFILLVWNNRSSVCCQAVIGAACLAEDSMHLGSAEQGSWWLMVKALLMLATS
ncbi:hypothetical protein Nepgr_018772 [Nepenthes gracilis]|uniref:Uncharacterized protein n=1 Tax=Nepenthes gracilis TaxID=150966 RepID=A0AAD3SU64_NEPGR|nr:hypothetical protein Nepgr_018772 [Nepenthes gracilis]